MEDLEIELNSIVAAIGTQDVMDFWSTKNRPEGPAECIREKYFLKYFYLILKIFREAHLNYSISFVIITEPPCLQP